MAPEERIKNLEVQYSVLQHKVSEHSLSDKEFKQKILEDLEYLKGRDIRVMTFIESRLKKEEESAEFWKTMRAKLISGGIWGIFVMIGYIMWYAFNNYIRSGGQ